MKPLLHCFSIFMRQIARDSMLYAVCIAPLLAACFFRFGIPRIELLLCEYLGKTSLLEHYYLLFDLFLIILTPYLFCFVSSMVMLTEYDENITGYLAVTPIGRGGYLISRLLIPAVISCFVSLALLHTFSLTAWPLWRMLLCCALTSLLSVAVSLLLVSVSHNRVEGMAISKLSGILMLGLPVPFFLFTGVQYLFTPLPSFWIAKVCTEHSALPAVPALLTSLVWIWVLYGRFRKKFT